LGTPTHNAGLEMVLGLRENALVREHKVVQAREIQ
jgi:hypothetical protein